MIDFTVPTTFSVDFVGELEKIDSLFSKGRVRIYYKNDNRNGTWITDSFAEILNPSITYVPIVATYDEESEDFLDHTRSSLKKAYGFVPADANPAWETGPDGKEYFTVDVILWTGYWPEAEKIIGKQHSMELDPSSIVGDWKVIGGEYYFVFQQGRFKGLCALGDVFMPCFEESAFYSLDQKNRDFFSQFTINKTEETGGEKMPEENIPVVEATVVEPVVVPVDATVVEPAEENTEFETVTTTVVETLAVTTESDNGFKETTNIVNLRETVTEYPDYEALYTAAQEEIAELKNSVEFLKNENAGLTHYRDKVIKDEKMSIIDSFKKKLSEDELEPFTSSLDTFSLEDLKTKLSIVLAEKALAEETIETPHKVNFVSHGSELSNDKVAEIIKKHRKN